jgi:hypothetical protein
MVDHEPGWGRGSYRHKRLLICSKSAGQLTLRSTEHDDSRNNACMGCLSWESMVTASRAK